MREPPKNYTTYEYRNEVGSYRRTFTLPATWNGRETYISFDGVDSFFYLWVNGHYVGCSKDSRDVAEFDISQWAKAGKNEVAVEVYRSSDGSFLEAQDMFRLPGIFRTVAVYSKPKVHVSDLKVIPAWHSDGTGQLAVDLSVANVSVKNVKDYTAIFKLFANKLYGDAECEGQTLTSTLGTLTLAKADTLTRHADFTVADVKPWTTEEPNVYTLVCELRDKKGNTVEAVSTQTGFRTVEIRDVAAKDDEFGLAGRYFREPPRDKPRTRTCHHAAADGGRGDDDEARQHQPRAHFPLPQRPLLLLSLQQVWHLARGRGQCGEP